MTKENKKVHKVTVRMTDDELKKVEEEAETSGLNRSEYIRFKLGISDEKFEDKLNVMEERQERILELLENYDLNKESLKKLTEGLCDVKIALLNVNDSVRSLRPDDIEPYYYYSRDPLYSSYVFVREKLDEIGDAVGLLWELQKY